MARVTIEKCVARFDNRFELVCAMVQRVKEIEKGDPVKVRRRNQKDPVLALREVEEGMIDPAVVREKMIIAKQKCYMQEEERAEIAKNIRGFSGGSKLVLTEPVENWKDMEIQDTSQFDSVDEDEMIKEEKE